MNTDSQQDSDVIASTSLSTKMAETECKLGERVVDLLTKNKSLEDALERCLFYAEDRNCDAVIAIVKNSMASDFEKP